MITPHTLAQSDLFADLSETQLATIIALAEEETHGPGETLFEEGQAASHLYILLSGEVTIEVQSNTSPQRLATASLNRPGQLVGWSGFVEPHSYTAAAICQAECRLLAIPGEKLMKALTDDPAMGFVVMRRTAELISGRLRNVQHFVLKSL